MSGVFAGSPPQIQMWRDCADAHRAGHSVTGLYHIYINRSDPVQVRATPDACPSPGPKMASLFFHLLSCRRSSATWRPVAEGGLFSSGALMAA